MKTKYKLLSFLLTLTLVFSLILSIAYAAEQTLNAYSIWPENWARPMFEEF